MKDMLSRLRRKYFLADSSQPRLLLGIELIFFVLLVISGIVFYLFANQDLTTNYYQAHLKIKNLKDSLLPILIGLNLAGLVISAVLALFFTHRIAGPLYRLNLTLRSVGKGDLDHRVKFRKGDEMKDVEAAAEEMLRGLNQRIASLKKLGTCLETLAKEEGTSAPLKQEITALQEILSGFILTEEGD